MLKRMLRSCLAAGCRGSGLLARAQQAAAGELIILCYHRVLPGLARATYFAPDLVVTPEALRAHCRVLSRHFDVLPLSRAIEAWTTRTNATRPLAVITFDDGYQDNYQFAAPVLAEMGLRATFFVISDLVGQKRRPWYDQIAGSLCVPALRTQILSVVNGHSRACEADKLNGNGQPARRIISAAKSLPPALRRTLVNEMESASDGTAAPDTDCIMTVTQLRELQAAGHEIGSHTRTHEMLPQLDEASLADEVAGSRRRLEEMLQAPVNSFCYPNGSLDERVVRHVREAGYAQGVTTRAGRNALEQDRMLLKRWFIHEERLSGVSGIASANLLRMEILGVADRVFARRRRAGDA